MKKNKNQPYSKPEANGQSILSEKIRGDDKTAREYPFKKVLYGYDPDEVASYINELSDSYEASARIHESKISSIKEELVLSNRERDSYMRKYKEAASKHTKPTKEDKDAEYEAVIASLKEKLELAENKKSRSAQTDNSELINGYLGRIAALEEENRALSSRLQALEHENKQMLAAAEKHSSLLGDYQAVCAQLELAKSEAAAKENENTALSEELENKIGKLNSLASENEGIKKKSAELEAENGVLCKSLEECRTEILHLKEAAKKQAYEYADKISSLESERTNAELAMKKELKLHDYYVNHAENALEQLAEQMEQIKNSMKNMQKI